MSTDTNYSTNMNSERESNAIVHDPSDHLQICNLYINTTLCLLKCSCMCDIQEILCSEARERNIHTETKNEEETRHKPNDMSRRPCTKYDIKISTIVNIC